MKKIILTIILSICAINLAFACEVTSYIALNEEDFVNELYKICEPANFDIRALKNKLDQLHTANVDPKQREQILNKTNDKIKKILMHIKNLKMFLR